MEQVGLPSKTVTGFNLLDQSVQNKSSAFLKLESGSRDGSADSSVEDGSLTSIASRANMQEPPTQSLSVPDSNGCGELVDVRVCDTCGDVGREALLALCSSCNDGAEHIYCMRIKMDEVPLGGWMCEECSMMQEPKRMRPTDVKEINSASNLSKLNEIGQGWGLQSTSSGARLVHKIRADLCGKATSLSRKRLRSEVFVNSVSKRRVLQSVNSAHVDRKKIASLLSSQNINGKSKGAVQQVTTHGDRYAKKVVEQICIPSGQKSSKHGFGGKESPSTKTKSLDKIVRSSKLSGFGGKELIPQLSLPKNLGNSKYGSPLKIRSSQEVLGRARMTARSQGPRPQFQRGCLRKSKSINLGDSYMKVRRSSENVHVEGKSAEESADGNLQKNCTGEKLSTFSLEKARPTSGHGSQGPRPPFQRGCLSKSKSINLGDSSMKVHRSSEDVEGKSAGGSAVEKFQKKCTGDKLSRSISFSNTGLSVPKDVSNACISHVTRVKDPNYGGERSIIYKRCPQQGLPPGSFTERAMTSERNTVQRTTKPQLREDVQDVKTSEVDGNSNLHANTSVSRSVKGTTLSAQRSYGIVSPVRKVYSFPEAEQSSVVFKTEVGCTSKDDNTDLNASVSGQPINLCSLKEEMPLIVSGDLDSPGNSAVPDPECIWKGSFKLENCEKLPNDCSGLQAHMSSIASSKLLDRVLKLQPEILLKEVPLTDTELIQFQKKCPTEEDIALYFFTEDLQSYERSYNTFLEGMVKHDLALEANLGGVKLLVFHSSLLPARSQCWNALSFLWGVFRERTVDDRAPCTPNVDVATMNQVSLSETVSALKDGSIAAIHTSQNFNHSVDPGVFQSASSTLLLDQSVEHEISSPEKSFCPTRLQDPIFCKEVSTPLVDQIKKGTFSGCWLCNGDLQELHKSTDQDMGNLMKTSSLECGRSKAEHPHSAAHSKELTYSAPCLPWSYECPPVFQEEDKRFDGASRSSFSVESGPSGSSDGVGCTKSDEGQVEQFQNITNLGALNLDLSLASGFDMGKKVDLDLGLGFPSPSRCQAKHSTMNRFIEDRNVSLSLSLGLPCSND